MADCTLTLDDGTHYDLSPLSSSTDYESRVGDLVYKLNVCRGIVSEVWNIDQRAGETIGGFVTREHGDFSIGSANSTLVASPSTLEPLLILSQGSPCPQDINSYASTAIRFVCSESDFHSGKPQLIAALPDGDPNNQCTFFFEWKTHVACPTHPRLTLASHWSYIWVFVALLVIAILAYAAGFTMYNRFVLGHRGWDQIPKPTLPHFSLPSLPSLSSLFRRPTSSSVGTKWGSWRHRGGSSAGYGQVRADDYDEEEALAGRFSLDDEDVEADEDARALAGDPSVWRNVRTEGAPPTGKAGAGDGKGDDLVNI